MALEDILSNLYAGLTSDKVTERKKCTDSLKEYLAGSGVPSILSANHKRNTGINWEKLFVKVHDLIVKEVEKFDSGKGASTQDTVRVQCSSLLSSVVTGANKAKCYINSEKILECMVEAFKSNRIMKYFSETYTSLLLKHVLQVSHYLNKFSPYEWADLLEASMELHERPSADASTVVRLVCCVLEEGTKRCQLTLAVRDNLQSLGALYLLQDSQRHHHMQENLLRIAVCCVNTVGAESRLATCVFLEVILASVIKFYEQQADVASNKKKYLFTFLRLCLVIHHPGASGQRLAGNWGTWIQGVYNMQQILRMEMALLGSSVKRLQHAHTTEWSSFFIPFAVELYYQMFNGSLKAPTEEEEVAPPSKKMKLEQGDTNTYGELVQSVTPTNYFPWVLIISAYFTQHGDSLSWEDKKATVDMLVNILNCENFSNIIKTWALFDSLVGISRELAKDETKLVELTPQLTSIWNTCVRKSAEVSLYQKCQNVIQSLLEISSIDFPIEALLKMYVEKNIPGQYTYEGLCTLHHLLTYHNSGLIDESLRRNVVAWIIDLSIPVQCEDVLPKLFFQLCVNENVQLQIKREINSENKVYRQLFDDLKFLILKSDFEDGLLFDKQTTQSLPSSMEKSLTFHKTISESILNRLLELTKDTTNFDVSVRSLSVAFKLISLLEKYKVFNSTLSTDFNQEMSNIFVRLPSLIKAIPQLSKDSRDLLKNLTSLYCSQDYTANVYKAICEATTKEVIECFCSLLGDQDETDMQDSMEFMDTDLDHQDETEINFKKSLLSILMNFCTQDTPFRDQILTFILDCDLYNVSAPAEFQTALYVLTFIVQKLDPGSVPIGACLNVLQSMCMKLYQDNTSVSSILTLLHHTLPVVYTHGNPNNKKNCAIMLNSFLKRCNTKFYNTSTTGQALQCLSWIQTHSNLTEWDECLDKNLLDYLSNTIHSVRLCGCLCIGLDMKTASYSHFNSLVSKLPDVFLIDERDLTENIISDECANRASTVLHCLASVFTLSPVWGKSALAEILKISHRKKLSPILMGKVFLCISKYLGVDSTQTLIEDNLAFFVNSWLSDGLSLDNFPNYLLLCVSKEDFFVKYKNLLIPHDMLWSGNVGKSEICQTVSQITSLPLNAVYKECLPNALALILPYMLHDKSSGSKWQPSKRMILASKNIYSLFCQTFKEAGVMESVTEYPVEVLKILLGCICDEEDMRTTMHWSGPLPHVDGPLLTTQDLATILNWINEKTQLDIIFHLCCDNPAAIQQLLLCLWENVEKQHNLESKLFCLHQYWTFCHLLPLSTKLNTFLCQYIVQTLLHFIDKYNNNQEQLQPLAVASCRMLFSLSKKFLPDIAPVVSKMLPSIVYTVTRAIRSNDDIREAGMSLLVYLIIDMNSVLPGAQYLDPLPNEEYFAKLNNVIKKISSRKNDAILKHIKGFIQGGTVGRFEGLRLLHDKLTMHQTELNALFTKLKAAKYSSEDCSGSLLHQLACMLIQIAGNKEDMQCCVEGLRCLGVLGISDYQTLTVASPLDPTHILQLPTPPLIPLHALPCLLTIYTTAMKADLCRAAARAITSLLQYKESVIALDLLSTNEDSALLKESLLPFTLARKSWLAVKIKIDPEGYKQLLASEYLWSSHILERDHSKWVSELTVGVLKSFHLQQCFLPDLLDICQLSPSFAEKITSPLIGLIFSYGSERQISDLVQKIQGLLDAHYQATRHLSSNTGPVNSGGKTQVIPKQSVQCLLDIVKFSFTQKKHYTNFVKSTASNISLFNLDLLTCSWAACSVGHHLAAVYFAELWCMIELDQNLPSGPDKIAELPRGTEMLAIMRKCHESMNDEAAVMGCGLSHLLDPIQRRQHYLKGGSYAEALLMHDCDGDVPTGSNLLPKLSLARSLQSAGLYKLTANYLNTSEASAELDSVKYDCCWKLGDWSLQVDPVLMESKSSHQSVECHHLWSAYHYSTLKNAVCQDLGSMGLTIQDDLRRSREFIATHWSVDSMENSQSVYEVCCKLQVLHEIECFSQTRQTYFKSKDVLDVQSLLTSWSISSAPPYSSFKLFEDILSQRCVMLENIMSQTSDSELVAPAVDLLLQYADLATSEGCPQLGIRWIGIARRMVASLSSSSRTLSGLVTLAEGDAAWRTGHHLVAQHLMKTYINNRENQADKHLYSSALRLYGSWMVESRSENALDILEKYLIKSLQELSPSGDPKERIKTYIIIAKFSDGEYKQVNSYMKSTAFLNKIKCMEQCKEKASSLRENHSNKIELTKDERKALFINDGQSKIDQIEITNTRTERNYFLQLAIKYYLTTLLEGDSNDLCIFRVISLWLDNPTLELATKRDSSNSKSISDLLKSIPSRKLLPVVSQLAPRLNSVDPQPHHKIIFDLIERCLLDHPHHVLPVLLALKNSYKDSEYSKDSASQSQKLTVRDAYYVVTAKKMLDGVVKKGSAKIVSIVKETELLSLALISLANFKVRNSKSMEQLIPKSEPLVKIKNLRNALIPTVTLPVRADCNYEDIPSVVFFSDKFFLVGGINVPKKMACTGSDGIQRPMLLKGEDDIRQDAVMQQVFVIVNQLLSRHQHRDTKKLTIRTYKVVALSRRSGIIEWCDGTEPLGRLLVGPNSTSGLHAAVRPGDMSSKEARRLMDEKRTSTNDEKLKVFKRILSKLRPVFHHFFFQNFLIPAVWYERKLAYTQSVATSSMIGYILGLGDRHVQNILVDKCTAEVIHIDLGVAFEQGRVQPTPETVPFRLTQDMVAGLGATGVEGVFTRCCERTMDVLRSNKDTLLTILEVLLCDPLYMWTISPRQAYSKQDLPPPSASNLTESSGGSGSEAERALLRVDNKLVGTEFGSTLTASGQVARLIQQATDISNLSRLFPGWQPYL